MLARETAPAKALSIVSCQLRSFDVSGVLCSFLEVEDGAARLGRCREPLPIEQLALKRREEALAERVVVGIAHRAHRGPDAGLATAEPEGDRRVLATLVRVMDDVGGLTLLDGHVQGGQDELGA